IVTPFHDAKEMTSGTVSRTDTRTFVADLGIGRGTPGAPVFAPGGTVLGVTTVTDESDDLSRGDMRVVRLDMVCRAIAEAQKKTAGTAPPAATPLPVEPQKPFPVDAL